MGVNRGKDFESVIKQNFESIEDISIDRLHDQTTGFAGSSNICDFIVYNYPHELYLECKSCYGNTLSFNNITERQWSGLLEKSKISGVGAGVMIWFIDHDKTVFIPIQTLVAAKAAGKKSINIKEIYDAPLAYSSIEVIGKKKRIFFEYDIAKFWIDFESYLKYGAC